MQLLDIAHLILIDNVEADSGSGGATFATDQIGGVEFPRMKLIHGADGTNDGDVAQANPFPVELRTPDGDSVMDDTNDVVNVAITVALPAGTNAIGKLAANSGVDIGDVDVTSMPSDTFVAEDGALGKGVLVQGDDGTDRTNVLVDTDGHVQVDVLSGGGSGTEYNEDAATPATITGGATLMERDDALTTVTPVEGDWIGFRGTAEGALWTQDFNSDALLADTNTIAGAVTGTEMQVDVVAALPAGTNAIGKLAANSGVDIGDVDVTSVPAPLNVTGGGTEATALRVTVASNSTGVLSVDDGGSTLSVDDGGGALTVDGTVTVQDGGGAITVDNGGTFAVQVDGDALNALQLIDNIVLAEDAVHGSGDSGVMSLAVRNDTLAALAGTDGDYAPLQVNASGALFVEAQQATHDSLNANANLQVGDADVSTTNRVPADSRLVSGTLDDGAGTSMDVKDAFGMDNTAADHTVIAAVVGKTIRVVGYQLQAHGGENEVYFKDSGGTVSHTWQLGDREGVVCEPTALGYFSGTGDNVALQINLSQAVDVEWHIQYVET